MARKRRGQPVHGWVVLDKPAGTGSTRAVSIVRRLFNAQKAGHGGTLDPLASGILPIALGEATKTVSWVMDGRKKYRFTVRWGEARDTDDGEGQVVETSDVRPDKDTIFACLDGFTGHIEQIPPAYSALKLDGKRAYDLARAGDEVVLKSRIVEIHDLSLIETPDSDHAIFEVSCGKGTYVRSLGRDIARKLGTVGYISALRRLAAGPFDESSAISLESLEGLVHSAPPSDLLLPVEAALDDIPAFTLDAEQADHLRHGRAVTIGGSPEGLPRQKGTLEDGTVVCAMADGRLVALARYEGMEIHPVRVLNMTD